MTNTPDHYTGAHFAAIEGIVDAAIEAVGVMMHIQRTANINPDTETGAALAEAIESVGSKLVAWQELDIAK
jgi:hypothetical protein